MEGAAGGSDCVPHLCTVKSTAYIVSSCQCHSRGVELWRLYKHWGMSQAGRINIVYIVAVFCHAIKMCRVH